MKKVRILHFALVMKLSLSALAGAQTSGATDPSLNPHLFLTRSTRGHGAEFISLLVPSRGMSPTITASAAQDGTITVHGSNWVDSVTLGEVIGYHRSIVTTESKSP